jgi:cbb3-type cytochrome oxidase subunit 1
MSGDKLRQIEKGMAKLFNSPPPSAPIPEAWESAVMRGVAAEKAALLGRVAENRQADTYMFRAVWTFACAAVVTAVLFIALERAVPKKSAPERSSGVTEILRDAVFEESI